MLLTLCSPTPLVNRRAATAHVVCLARKESWRETDSATILGSKRSPAKDAGDLLLEDEDDYTTLDLEVISRAAEALKSRRAQLNVDDNDQLGSDAEALVRTGLALQSARQGNQAELHFLAALTASRSCGAAWYGLGSLLHEYQHGGLDDARTPPEVLAEAADCALIAARYVAAPRTGPETHAPQPMPAL